MARVFAIGFYSQVNPVQKRGMNMDKTGYYSRSRSRGRKKSDDRK